MHLLEDVGHGGMKMAEVEEVSDMKKGIEAMTGITGMKNDVRKKMRSSMRYRNHQAKPMGEGTK